MSDRLVPVRLSNLLIEGVEGSDGRYITRGGFTAMLPVMITGRPRQDAVGETVGAIDSVTQTLSPDSQTVTWSGTGNLYLRSETAQMLAKRLVDGPLPCSAEASHMETERNGDRLTILSGALRAVLFDGVTTSIYGSTIELAASSSEETA